MAVVSGAETLLKGNKSLLKKTHVIPCLNSKVAFQLLRIAGDQVGFR